MACALVGAGRPRPGVLPFLAAGWVAFAAFSCAAGARALRAERAPGYYLAALGLRPVPAGGHHAGDGRTVSAPRPCRRRPAPRPPATLARCFWRCLFLQAAWNRRGMQNLGFAYAVDPALRALYPDPRPAQRGAARATSASSTATRTRRPASSAAPSTTRSGWRPGEEPPGAPLAYKPRCRGRSRRWATASSGPALRPFFGALAALGALLLGWPALVRTVLALQRGPPLLRVGLFRAGYRRGDARWCSIGRLSLPALAARLRVGERGAVRPGRRRAGRSGRGGTGRRPPRSRSRCSARATSPWCAGPPLPRRLRRRRRGDRGGRGRGLLEEVPGDLRSAREPKPSVRPDAAAASGPSAS